MAQSLNKTVEFHTTGVSYLGVGGKVRKMLLGNAAFEFYADTNVENYIQIPGRKLSRSVPMFEDIKLAVILKFSPKNQSFSLLQKIQGKF